MLNFRKNSILDFNCYLLKFAIFNSAIFFIVYSAYKKKFIKDSVNIAIQKENESVRKLEEIVKPTEIENENGYAGIKIIFASEWGSTAASAQRLKIFLTNKKINTPVVVVNIVDHVEFTKDLVYIFLISTIGNGEMPTVSNQFFLKQNFSELNEKIYFGVIGYGDKSFDNYAYGGLQFNKKMKKYGFKAQKIWLTDKLNEHKVFEKVMSLFDIIEFCLLKKMKFEDKMNEMRRITLSKIKLLDFPTQKTKCSELSKTKFFDAFYKGQTTIDNILHFESTFGSQYIVKMTTDNFMSILPSDTIDLYVPISLSDKFWMRIDKKNFYIGFEEKKSFMPGGMKLKTYIEYFVDLTRPVNSFDILLFRKFIDCQIWYDDYTLNEIFYRSSYSIIETILYYIDHTTENFKLPAELFFELSLTESRKYSVSSAPINRPESTTFELLIKEVYTDIDGRRIYGKVSKWLKNLALHGIHNDKIYICKNSGNSYLPKTIKNCFYVGGGVGTAAIRSFIDYKLNSYLRTKIIPKNLAESVFLIGLRTLAEFEFIFGRVIENIIPDFNIVVYLSRDRSVLTNFRFNSYDVIKIENEKLVYVINYIENKSSEFFLNLSSFFLMGSIAFCNSVEKSLKEKNVQETKIIKECW